VDNAKNVGAHRPTKIPNRSPWAKSGSLERNQIAIDATTDANPATKQIVLRARHAEVDISSPVVEQVEHQTNEFRRVRMIRMEKFRLPSLHVRGV
jgi:hypothetical protein